MKATVENGKVVLDYCELFNEADGRELQLLVQSLACQDDIVRHVTDQLLEGWTEDGYHGGKCGDASESHTPIDQARRRIALGAGQVAKETIEAQQRSLKDAAEANAEIWRKYHKLQDEARQ